MAGESNNNASNNQAFSFETVAALVAALLEKNHTLGMKDYELMASLDGSRSASAFDHQFRKVKTRAKELLAAKNGGEGGTPSTKVKGKAKSATPASAEGDAGGKATGTKRGRKPKKMGDDGDVEDEESPTKKVKPEPVEEWAGFTGGEGDVLF